METTLNDYFCSYEDLEVHRLMLEDEPRTEAYRKAILGNKNYFENKTILDVGCGTGILSIFCAQAGAKKVYAVEASSLAKLAKEISKDNNFEDVIEVIHSKVEDVILPEKVDAIVSEWMGFYLLHEGMLDSVLYARDKFLKVDGVMFPETAAIYVAPCSVPEFHGKWKDFHGVSLSKFAKHLRDSKSSKPEIMQIQAEDLLGDDVQMAWINLREDTIKDLDSFSVQHVVGANKNGKYQGICVWFECHFPEFSNESCVVLSTSPADKVTHWKQTVILFADEQDVEEQEPIAFQLDMNRSQENNRRYNLELSLLDPEVVEHPIPCTCDMTKCILIKTMMENTNSNNIVNNVSEEEKSSENDDN